MSFLDEYARDEADTRGSILGGILDEEESSEDSEDRDFIGSGSEEEGGNPEIMAHLAAAGATAGRISPDIW